MTDPPRPRLATVVDAEAINAIYNHYVRTSAATFQVDDETTEERVEELRTRPNDQPMIVLEANGIGQGTIRVSVGLEHAGDLIADFEHALAAIPD